MHEQDGPAAPGAAELDEAARSARRAIERIIDQHGNRPDETLEILGTARAVLAEIEARGRRAEEPGAGDALFFDVSDLLDYYPYNRAPTGIQRVQISVILSFLAAPGGRAVTLCRFSRARDTWLEVPQARFRAICALSLIDGDPTEPGWMAEVARLDRTIEEGAPLRFTPGAVLVNLGTSWWLPNYFLQIRKAKREFAIRYVPLIHDVIPAILPEYCAPVQVQEFIDWLLGVIQHADFYFTVSDATRGDLLKLAGELGYPIDPDRVVAVPLASELHGAAMAVDASQTALARWGLKPGRFVLFVATIEDRKNQIAAFDAWQNLINRHGAAAVPRLICVGKNGWQAKRAHQRLRLSDDLAARVEIIDRVDDTALAALYRACLFTIFPSHYEGWGLPVTESISYGKVPVIADNSSLPQASGGLGVSFRTGSLADFVAALDRMIFDDGFRKAKEEAIRRRFVPRTWAAVAGDMAQGLDRFTTLARDTPPLATRPPLAGPGYYPLRRNRALHVRPGMTSVELYRRSGWHRLDDAGTWSTPAGGALGLRLAEGPGRIGIELLGLPTIPTDFTVALAEDADIRVSGRIGADVRRWVFLDIPARLTGDALTVHIRGRDTELETIDPDLDDPPEPRELGVGIRGFFIFDGTASESRMDFVEALALGALGDRLVTWDAAAQAFRAMPILAGE